jgi:hypothetical protein
MDVRTHDDREADHGDRQRQQTKQPHKRMLPCVACAPD